MKQLGTLKKVPIREIWKREPDFSAWLSEDDNIALLSQKIGVDILAEETEAGVGDFSADILAKEDGGDRLVIIENQYGDTNHDHLGKLITYAAGRGAKVLIWIIENARDEHRAAVQWLNDNTAADIGVFLVQIEIFVIGDSQPAPSFTVLEAPNDWVRSTRQCAALSERGLKLAAWWTSFMDYALSQPEFKKYFSRRKGQPQHWLALPIGSSQYHIELTVTKDHLGAEIYIHDSKDFFNSLLTHKEEIEKELGFEMDWRFLPDKKASRILVTRPGDFSDIAGDRKYFEWYCEKAVALKKVFPKYANEEGNI